jgi:microcystin-dependent protein
MNEDYYTGEIILFAGNFVPSGWALCDGQLLKIANYKELFSLIGVTYGGDGVTTFALPDLRGRVPVHRSAQTPLASKGGEEKVTLTADHIPAHNHSLVVAGAAADSPSPQGYPAIAAKKVYLAGTPSGTMSPKAVGRSGHGLPHNNMQPYVCINYIINLQGSYPTSN